LEPVYKTGYYGLPWSVWQTRMFLLCWMFIILSITVPTTSHLLRGLTK